MIYKYFISSLCRKRDARQKRKLTVLTETVDDGMYDKYYELKFESKLFDINEPNRSFFPLSAHCESPEPVSAAGLQALTLTSLPSLTESSCGFTPEEASYQVPEQSIDLSQAFMTSQMSDISIPVSEAMQEAQGHEAANSLIEE